MNDPFNTPKRRALRKTCSRFVQNEIIPHLGDWEQAGEIPRELHKAAAAAGLLGVGFPEDAGGCGGDAVDTAVIAEAFIASGASSGLVTALFTHDITLLCIASAGSAELVDRFVRPTLAGDKVSALALTEPDAGFDLARLGTTAVRGTDRRGDHYLVNGAKTLVTAGVRADFVTTAVRTGTPRTPGTPEGVSLLVIEKDLPGFTVSRRLDQMGWLCSDTAELALADVRVPAANLVGTENEGFTLLVRHFAGERLALATHAYSIAARALKLTVQYAKARSTFGQPLIDRQVVQHRLVRMRQQVELARAYTRSIMVRAAAGEDVLAEACLAKNAAVEACSWVVDQAVHLHGGMGYLRESELERHHRDARVLDVAGGGAEVLNDLVARLSGYRG